LEKLAFRRVSNTKSIEAVNDQSADCTSLSSALGNDLNIF